jgi:uncharacterized membrane protein YdjX (TVP38/TMEM64 family)
MKGTTRISPKRLESIFSALFSLALVGLAIYIATSDMQRIRVFVSTNGVAGLGLALVIFTMLGATVVPSEPLTLLIATVFGPFTATVTASLGNLGAAMVEYYLGTRLGNAASFIERKEKLPWGLGKLPVTSPVFLIFGRMLPGYGAKLIGLLSGLYRVPILLYLWTSAIQTVLGAASFAYAGTGIMSLLRH